MGGKGAEPCSELRESLVFASDAQADTALTGGYIAWTMSARQCLLSIGGMPTPGGHRGEGPVKRSGLRMQCGIAALWDMKSFGQRERGAVAAG